MSEDFDKEQIEDEDILYEDIDFEDENNLSQSLKKMREKYKQCQTERQEYLAGWQRAKADLINARKDFEGSKNKIINQANEDFIHELLPILDAFSGAFSNKEAWEKVDKNWRTGVEYIHRELVKTLEVRGIQEFGASGDPFNPLEHTAVTSIDTDDKKMDHIIESVIQPGYRLKDKVLRPARVNVFVYSKSL
jgi:molecular chaperone GrpE